MTESDSTRHLRELDESLARIFRLGGVTRDADLLGDFGQRLESDPRGMGTNRLDLLGEARKVTPGFAILQVVHAAREIDDECSDGLSNGRIVGERRENRSVLRLIHVARIGKRNAELNGSKGIPLVAGPAPLVQPRKMKCHGCGSEHELAPGDRVRFREECARCSADLHVCRNCTHHDPSVYNECRESSAERILDKERANRCDYFRPGSAAEDGTDPARANVESELEKLFRK